MSSWFHGPSNCRRSFIGRCAWPWPRGAWRSSVVPGDVALKPLSAQQGLRAALSEALAHDGPVLVDVVSARQELAMPPKTRLDDAQHFGMFLIKAVLDGRGTQLIDLARTNLIR